MQFGRRKGAPFVVGSFVSDGFGLSLNNVAIYILIRSGISISLSFVQDHECKNGSEKNIGEIQP